MGVPLMCVHLANMGVGQGMMEALVLFSWDRVQTPLQTRGSTRDPPGNRSGFPLRREDYNLYIFFAGLPKRHYFGLFVPNIFFQRFATSTPKIRPSEGIYHKLPPKPIPGSS
eukprot:EG_transcript_39840